MTTITNAASEVLVERSGAVATVTLNRPRAMNALSKSLLGALTDAFGALVADDAVRVLILTGAGERAFCAGLDLKELSSDTSLLANAEAASRNPVAVLDACDKPIIGAINGVAITGGFELALACDVLIASTAARFADTHGRVGLLPGWGLSQKLSRIVGLYRAKELSLTGNFLDAKTAAAWGLVNRVVEPAELLPAARKLAADMAQVEPAILGSMKRLIDDGYGLPFGEAMRLEQERFLAYNSKVSSADLAERRAGVQARGRAQ